MKHKIIIFSFIGGILSIQYIFLMSCHHESLKVYELDTICFNEEVLPLLQTSCGTSGCHDQATQKAGLNVTDYTSILNYVKPGEAHKSELYYVLTNINGKNMMPPNQPLDKQQRTLIRLWIEQGAKDIICRLVTDTNFIDTTQIKKDSVCFEQNIYPIFLNSCAISGCHDNVTHLEGYNFTSYNGIVGPEELVIPYNPEESEIYEVIFEGEMPPVNNPQLNSEQIQLIRQWIIEGALNSSCDQNQCDEKDSISFVTDVWPVINTNCIGCHNTDKPTYGINLDSYENIISVANDIRDSMSVLIGAISQEVGFIAMPPFSQLDDCKIEEFAKWIDQGTKNN